MVHSQTEAKRLFVEKVLTQARIEGVSLSDAERKMLSWSESDPDFATDLQLPPQLAAEIFDEEYEKEGDRPACAAIRNRGRCRPGR